MNANNLKIGDRVYSPGLGCWVDSTIKRIEGQYLVCADTKHGGEFRVHAARCLSITAFTQRDYRVA